MNKLSFSNGTIFTGSQLLRDQSVVCENGVIQQIISPNILPADTAVYDLQGGILAPGFIDIQVNGGCGRLFNDSPDLETITAMIDCHQRHGTTMLFPTLISTDYTAMVSAYNAVETALAKGIPGLGGLHFEGPYLNKSRKGIHDVNSIRDIAQDNTDTILKPFNNGKLIMTVAPEKIPTQTVKQLAGKGILLLAGHSDADFDQALHGFSSGILGVTHLFNAMSQFGSRAPGLVGAALMSKESWCSTIVDGYHVHPATLQLAIAAKGAEKFILVTDGMPSSGSAIEEYYLGNTRIEVFNGRCTSTDGTLAGSNLTMIQAVKNCIDLLELPIETALAMASLHPARFLGIAHRYGRIEIGYFADLVHLDNNLNVVRSWVKGR